MCGAAVDEDTLEETSAVLLEPVPNFSVPSDDFDFVASFPDDEDSFLSAVAGSGTLVIDCVSFSFLWSWELAGLSADVAELEEVVLLFGGRDSSSVTGSETAGVTSSPLSSLEAFQASALSPFESGVALGRELVMLLSGVAAVTFFELSTKSIDVPGSVLSPAEASVPSEGSMGG